MTFNEAVRSNFTIYMLLGEIDEAADVKTELGSSGYDAYLFTDQDTLLERIREHAPHVILFSVNAVMGTLSEFVQQVLGQNSEIVLIPVADSESSPALAEYREYNFYQFVNEGSNLPVRCLWAVDSACWILYLTYQNEQLFVQVNEVQPISVPPQSAPPESELTLENRLQSYQPSQSKEDLIEHFLRGLELKQAGKGQQLGAIFFRYLPSVNSLVATQSLGMTIADLKGVGVKLATEEGRNLNEFFAKDSVPAALRELMADGLGIKQFFSKALFVNKSLEGVFVLWSSVGELQTNEILDEFVLFSLLYQNVALIKRLEFVDDMDRVTDLYKREYYLLRLNEEVARAQRLERPVSVAKLMLDDYDELGQSLGPSNRDLILRAIAKLVTKSSRINDISCRTQDNEISLILPHTDKKGAALRGERLRRMIENHSFAISGVRVSVSLGVSEFPALCESAAELEISATKAVEFINQQGGNKVCLYRSAE